VEPYDTSARRSTLGRENCNVRRLTRLDRPIGVLLLCADADGLWSPSAGARMAATGTLFVTGYLADALGRLRDHNDVADRRSICPREATSERVVATGEVGFRGAGRGAVLAARRGDADLDERAARAARRWPRWRGRRLRYVKRFFSIPKAMLGVGSRSGSRWSIARVQGGCRPTALMVTAAKFLLGDRVRHRICDVDRDDDRQTVGINRRRSCSPRQT